MRLITYEKQSTLRLGVWLGDYVLDAQNAVRHCPLMTGNREQILASCSSMLSLLNSPDETWKTLRVVSDYYLEIAGQQTDELMQEGILMPAEAVMLHTPLPTPGKVICVAGNYPGPGAGQKPEYPTIFLKPSSSVTGPDMPVWVTDLTRDVAYEVELAVVIGKRAHLVSSADAMQYVAGYTLANDMGDRQLEQRTSQWTSGKMFDSFTPIGPWIATQDEIPSPGALAMRTLVNEQLVQKGNTSDMFFDIPELIRILSTLTTLVPGDLVLTGSTKMMDGQPNPALALKPGDYVTIQIDGLGTLTNPILKEL